MGAGDYGLSLSVYTNQNVKNFECGGAGGGGNYLKLNPNKESVQQFNFTVDFNESAVTQYIGLM